MSLSDKLKSQPYRTVNFFLSGFILAIFIYSAAFNPDRSRHPIPSAQSLIGSEKTISTGLSRAFSSIVRLEFQKAYAYNPHAMRIFNFFLIQLFLRICLLVSYPYFKSTNLKQVITIDALLSTVLFIVFFEPFWREIFGLQACSF